MHKSIDLFNHFLPPEFYDRIIDLGGNTHMMNRARKDVYKRQVRGNT